MQLIYCKCTGRTEDVYIVSKSGTFQGGETITGGQSGAADSLHHLAQTKLENNGSFASIPTARLLQFNATDGNAFKIQSVSSVTANSVVYRVLVFSTSRATPVADGVDYLLEKNLVL